MGAALALCFRRACQCLGETRVGVRASFFAVRIPHPAMPARKSKSNAIHRDRLYATFARNLKRLRQRAGLKMYAAADALGVAKSTWSQWESGQRFPNGEMLAALADCIQVRPCVLLQDMDGDCHGLVHNM